MAAEDDADFRAISAFLLNGRSPRPNRERRQSVERPIDPAELDPYDLLVWEQAPNMGRAALFNHMLDWSAVFTLSEARAWFAAGARLHDLETPRRFHELGVPPRIAGTQVYRHNRPTGMTFFQMVRQHRMTVEQVRDIAVRTGALRSKTEDQTGENTGA